MLFYNFLHKYKTIYIFFSGGKSKSQPQPPPISKPSPRPSPRTEISLGGSTTRRNTGDSKSAGPARTEELTLFRQKSTLSRQSSESLVDGNGTPIHSTSIEVAFDAEKVKTPGKGGRGGTLADSRKRIQQAMGRR